MLGTPFHGTLAGGGQEQIFSITLANPTALSIVVSDPNVQDQNELYVSAGIAPTRDTFQYSSSGPGANQTVALTAQAGTYYIMVYSNLVLSPGSQYSVVVQATPFVWTGFTPGQVNSGQDTTVLATGVFPQEYVSSTAYQIQFVSSAGVFPSSPLYLVPTSIAQSFLYGANSNGTSTMSAVVPANTLAAGTYAVKITDNSGNTQTMPGALTVTSTGAGVLKTSINVLNTVGPDQPSTIYVTYTNVGTAPMAAPLLVLTATQNGQQGAFLTLDPSLAGKAYDSATTPAGYGPSVQFLASGQVPGVLEPFESETVQVYNAGWLSTQFNSSGPPVMFSLGELDTTSTQTIDWSSMEAGLQSGFSQAAWSAIYPILTGNLGSTWGQFVRTLDDDSTYLFGIGQTVTDVGSLLSFEIEKANAGYSASTAVSVAAEELTAPGIDLTFDQSFQTSISGHYTKGILGLGWTTNWDISAATLANGDAIIDDNGVSESFSLQPDGSFAAQAGAEGTALTHRRCLPACRAGRLSDSVQHERYAGLRSGHSRQSNHCRLQRQSQLISLTDSTNGEYLHLSYNSQGLLNTLTDSTGQTETYGYDSTGHLTSYTDEYGTESYSYVTGQAPAANNALSQITLVDGNQIFFSYDSEGRLIDRHGSGGLEDETWTYLSRGGYFTTNAVGDQTTVYLNSFGSTSETIDALGNFTRFYYDGDQNLTKVIGPGGATTTSTYDANGNLMSRTDPLGQTTTFSYNANNNLTSYTDPKGNQTTYGYDSQDDLLSITYANGTQEQSSYNPLGEATQYITPNGQATGYTYNAQGLVASETFADGSSFSYTYDARGNMLTATDSSGTITFSHTVPGNPDLLTEVEYPDGTFLQFTYNSNGQRTQSVDQTGFTVNYSYAPTASLPA